MLRTICNYFRQCACNHDFELIANVHSKDVCFGTDGFMKVYRCKRCGLVQKVRF